MLVTSSVNDRVFMKIIPKIIYPWTRKNRTKKTAITVDLPLVDLLVTAMVSFSLKQSVMSPAAKSTSDNIIVFVTWS